MEYFESLYYARLNTQVNQLINIELISNCFLHKNNENVFVFVSIILF